MHNYSFPWPEALKSHSLGRQQSTGAWQLTGVRIFPGERALRMYTRFRLFKGIFHSLLFYDLFNFCSTKKSFLNLKVFYKICKKYLWNFNWLEWILINIQGKLQLTLQLRDRSICSFFDEMSFNYSGLFKDW